jgi:regulator of protease activity HflC (stomatin/prohibitin superfamily)
MGITDLLKWLFEQFYEYLLPFYIIPVFERGVRLRCGVHPKLIKPGLRFKIPFIDFVHTCIVTVDTMSTHAVHITTKDNKTITVTPVIEYEIDDAVKWLIETNDASTNLHDILRGEVADYLTDIDWQDCIKRTTSTAIKNKVQNRVKDMGVTIRRFILADLCINKVIITSI